MINAVIQSVQMLSLVIQILIFVRFILSWISMGRPSPVLGIIYTLTEPLFSPVRRLLEKSPLGGPGMMIDIAPIIVLFFIRIAETFIVNFLGAL